MIASPPWYAPAVTPDVPAWRAAIEAHEAEHPAVALARVRRLLAARPGDWAARLLLVKLLTEFARYAEARAVLEALADDPISARPRPRLLVIRAVAELHDRAGDHEPALRAYARLRELAPDDTDGFVLGGALAARLGRLIEAEAIYRAGTACTAGALDECWHNLGLVLRAQERPVEAAAAFARALELDPAYAAARAALADVTAVLTLGELEPAPAAE